MLLSLRLALAALLFGLVSSPAEAQDENGANAQDVPAQTAPAADDEPVRYASLAEAVAAQSPDGVLDDELSCMASAIYFESKGEPLAGQLAVADVILNRTRSGRFPKTVCSVVTQPGQFSFVREGQVPDVPDCAAYRTAIAVARVAMTDIWESPAGAALFFHARRISPGWHRAQIVTIGNQVFYR